MNFPPTERNRAGHSVRRRQRLGDSQARTPLDHHQETRPGVGCSAEQSVDLVGLDVHRQFLLDQPSRALCSLGILAVRNERREEAQGDSMN